MTALLPRTSRLVKPFFLPSYYAISEPLALSTRTKS